MKTQKMIIPFIALSIICMMAADVLAQKTIAEKVDSIFVIASSLDIKYRDSVGPAREAIAALGAEAVPHLIEMLGTPHGRERAALEDIFKKMGDQVIPQMNQALLTTDSLRLSRVAKILYFFPDTSSIENLLKIKNNDYYSARYQGIRALGKIGDHRATPAVREAMADSNELVRTIAAVSAGRLNDSTLLPDLIAAFDDNYYGTRMSAREALKNIECADKAEFISDVLLTASNSARKYLLSIIAQDSCAYDLNAIKPSLDDGDPLIKSLALNAAFRIDPEFITEYVSQMQEIPDSFILRQTIERFTADEKTKTSPNP